MERLLDLVHAVVVASAPTVVAHLLERVATKPSNTTPEPESFQAYVMKEKTK